MVSYGNIFFQMFMFMFFTSPLPPELFKCYNKGYKFTIKLMSQIYWLICGLI